MKKLFFTVLTFSILFTSCKTEAKKETNNVKKTVKKTAPFSLKKATNSIDWTAYKTTEKIPVKGQFKKVNIISDGEGNTIKEAINNTAFSIPISSIFTKDESRDFKIRKFFFGVMAHTALLSGTLMLTDSSSGTAAITMNGITQKVPFTYTINNNTFSMTTSININNWKAGKALTSLNDACKDLHKGADGVSKTWSEVALRISSVF